MAIRIKLTKNFQDLTQLIPNYSPTTTYRFQLQGKNSVEFVESETMPDNNLSDSVARFVLRPFENAVFSQDGNDLLFARICDDCNCVVCHLSIQEV